ncbi:hypothetical protein [Acetobacterium bakii]|nr:hypothetical protein [Acetobacterium bakii]
MKSAYQAAADRLKIKVDTLYTWICKAKKAKPDFVKSLGIFQ